MVKITKRLSTAKVVAVKQEKAQRHNDERWHSTPWEQLRSQDREHKITLRDTSGTPYAVENIESMGIRGRMIREFNTQASVMHSEGVVSTSANSSIFDPFDDEFNLSDEEESPSKIFRQWRFAFVCYHRALYLISITFVIAGTLFLRYWYDYRFHLPVHFVQDTTGRSNDRFPGSTISHFCLFMIAANPLIVGVWLFFSIRSWSIDTMKRFAYVIPWYLMPFTLVAIVYNSYVLRGVKANAAEAAMRFRLFDFGESLASQIYWETCQSYFQCCGVKDSKEWLEIRQSQGHSVVVPKSCCKSFYKPLRLFEKHEVEKCIANPIPEDLVTTHCLVKLYQFSNLTMFSIIIVSLIIYCIMFVSCIVVIKCYIAYLHVESRTNDPVTFTVWEYLERLVFVPRIKKWLGKELVIEVPPKRHRKQRLISRSFFFPNGEENEMVDDDDSQRPKSKAHLDDLISFLIHSKGKDHIFDESQSTIGEL